MYTGMGAMNKKVLIFDDDKKLQELVTEYLEGYGYSVATRPDGTGAVDDVKKENPDIIILDIMMPGKDGLEVLKDIRAVTGTPVIMLTARGEDTDRIIGLELGSDDYLSKPFNPRELLARMKAVLRRSDGGPSGEEETTLSCGEYTLDRAAFRLSCAGNFIELSTTEFRILEALMRRPNTVLSRDDIMNHARGRDFMAFERSIDVHISKLRSKVESLSGARDTIKTIWGSGYMFVV